MLVVGCEEWWWERWGKIEEGCSYLAFDKVAYSCLGHDGYRDGFHNLLDHFGVRHACYAALCPDICRDTFKRHDGAGTCFFCYTCLHKVSDRSQSIQEPVWESANLLCINNVHDHAALEHFSQPSLHGEVGGATVAV